MSDAPFSGSALAILLLWVWNGLAGQQSIIYTYGFTEKLAECHLDYYKPLEEWYHVSPKTKDTYMPYDLVIVNEDAELEIRYALRPYADQPVDKVPHVEIMRLMQHIAINDENAEIRALILDEETLRERFNADWGICQYFIPKKTYADFPFGTLISLYAEGKATAHAIVLYRDVAYDPLEKFYQLRFRE